jgi:hypothetical protein
MGSLTAGAKVEHKKAVQDSAQAFAQAIVDVDVAEKIRIEPSVVFPVDNTSVPTHRLSMIVLLFLRLEGKQKCGRVNGRHDRRERLLDAWPTCGEQHDNPEASQPVVTSWNARIVRKILRRLDEVPALSV